MPVSVQSNEQRVQVVIGEAIQGREERAAAPLKGAWEQAVSVCFPSSVAHTSTALERCAVGME